MTYRVRICYLYCIHRGSSCYGLILLLLFSILLASSWLTKLGLLLCAGSTIFMTCYCLKILLEFEKYKDVPIPNNPQKHHLTKLNPSQLEGVVHVSRVWRPFPPPDSKMTSIWRHLIGRSLIKEPLQNDILTTSCTRHRPCFKYKKSIKIMYLS